MIVKQRVACAIIRAGNGNFTKGVFVNIFSDYFFTTFFFVGEFFTNPVRGASK